MLTKDEEKYLLTIPKEKIIKIFPYDSSVIKIVDEIKNQIKNSRINFEIKFMGASALKISGQGDIDLYILCPRKNFQIYLPRLEQIFGKDHQDTNSIKWQFEKDGHEIEMYLTDPASPNMKRQIKVFEILRNSPKLLKEYESIKLSSDGQSFREYMRKKYEFYNKILN